ncbi:MAG: AMP-binding protein, partial [candidate division NC10 bacterium]
MLLVGEHLRHNAPRFPAKVALIDARGRITYGELNRLANRLARDLAAAGCRRGDRVAILGDSRIESVAASLGIVKAGAVAVPCNYRLTPEEIAHSVLDSGSRLLFVTAEQREALASQVAVERTVVLDGAGPDGLEAFVAGQAEAEPEARVEPHDANVIHDRLKDMIKTGGLNVYSQEVEHILLTHPAVREAGVIGLPSEKWGEEVPAVVVLRDGHAATEAELLAFCKE